MCSPCQKAKNNLKDVIDQLQKSDQNVEKQLESYHYHHQPTDSQFELNPRALKKKAVDEALAVLTENGI